MPGAMFFISEPRVTPTQKTIKIMPSEILEVWLDYGVVLGHCHIAITFKIQYLSL